MDYFAPFFLLLISLFYARLNSISREDFFFTKYIIIKNKTLAEILISGSILIKKGKVQKNEHRERISVCGIVLYAISIILTLILLLCYILKSDFIEFLKPISAVNLFLNIIIDTINRMPYIVNQAKHKKIVKASYILLCVFMSLVCLLVFIGAIGLL